VTVWAIIPAHNEASRVGAVIQKVKKLVDTVLVVDDGSEDDTFDVSKKAGAQALKHIV